MEEKALNDVQLCATSQLALVMGDKAKPGDRVQHEGRVSEIIVTREHTHHLLDTHTYRYQYKGPATGPVKWVNSQREGPNYFCHKYTHKVPFKSPWVRRLPHDYAHSLHTQHLYYTQGPLCQNSHQTGLLQWSSEMRCIQPLWKRRAFCGRRERRREGGQSRQLAGQQLLVICSLWGESIFCHIQRD